MTQDFTISVPDQLWVDSWGANATKTYTYDGPETVYVAIDVDNYSIHNTSTTELTADPGNTFIVEVTAADYPERAMMVVENNDTDGYEHTFEDETNFDDSVHKKITNPRLSDYFELSYHPIPADWDQERGLELTSIYKSWQSKAYDEAVRRRDYVLKYSNMYEFESADQTKVDTYLTAINSHITTLSTAYPWKFSAEGGVPMTSIPKIPAALVTVFNSLPTEV